MTTEEKALQAAIDAEPADLTARGALCDYLDETGDQRAGGYRALYRLGRLPCLRTQPQYHDGHGLTRYTHVEVFVSKPLTRKLIAIPRSEQHMYVSELNRTMDLPADGVHSLPRAWFNACYGNWLTGNDLGMQWVVAQERKTLDDMVAGAFNDTPKAFREHVLNCPLPVAFPFWFLCPDCLGGRFSRVVTDDPRGWKTLRVEKRVCETCKGKGMFREEYRP
ncbi:MAG TPA: hypothetical protein VMZ71_09110 [Gemmataceae bacterium]|nr:hypothetical protein [Gemmataceae bacterium]